MRKTPALLAAVAFTVVAGSLVGCSANASADCAPPYVSGDASSIVKVSGAASKPATASFPTPLVAKSSDSQVSQNTAGTGSPIREGDQVDFEYTVFSGKTGEELGSSSFGANGASTPRAAAVLTNGGTQKTTSLIRSLICRTSGERYTLVSTAKDAFGAGTLTSNGIANSDTLVIVVDVKNHFIGKANGTNLLPQDGMPNVITAVNGQPGIVLQELVKPTTLRIATIKQGSGATVKKGAIVHVKYAGFTWPSSAGGAPVVWPGGQGSDGTTVPDGDATWTQDQAADITVTSSGLPVGLYKALLGAKVGSQVLAVIPPKDGFGDSSASYGFTAKDTVIMVIDVLGVAKS